MGILGVGLSFIPLLGSGKRCWAEEMQRCWTAFTRQCHCLVLALRYHSGSGEKQPWISEAKTGFPSSQASNHLWKTAQSWKQSIWSSRATTRPEPDSPKLQDIQASLSHCVAWSWEQAWQTTSLGQKSESHKVWLNGESPWLSSGCLGTQRALLRET